MRKLGLTTGIIALFAGALVALSACGPLEETCATNDDCPGEEVCHTSTQQCLVKCTDNPNTCREGEACEPAAGGERGCLPQDDNADTGGTDAGQPDAAGDANMTDAGCRDIDCPGTQVCNDEGMCVEPAPEYKFIQAKDTSENQCTNEDPGADLYAAELLDADGNTLGWGQTVAYNGAEASSSNTYTRADTVFAGTAPELTEADEEAARCPSDGGSVTFDQDSVVSLGCGGAIVLSFTDDEGNAVTLEEGQTVQVWEYGSQCTDGSDDDVQLSVCTSQTASNINANGYDENTGNYATCDTGEAASGNALISYTIDSLPESDGGS